MYNVLTGCEKPFKCSLCPYSTCEAITMEGHILLCHTREGEYKCSLCSYSTTRPDFFQRHVDLHAGAKPFKCPVCSYAATTSQEVKSHIRLHTGAGDKPFKCTLCPYETTTSACLKEHMRHHGGEAAAAATFDRDPCRFGSNAVAGVSKDSTCTRPGDESFKCLPFRCTTVRAEEAKAHIGSHKPADTANALHVAGPAVQTYARLAAPYSKAEPTRKKPYKCPYCDHSTFRELHMKEHVRTHTGEKPFKCSLCNYAATSDRQMKLHKRIHTGEKPYVCPMCDYSAATLRQVRYHMHTHTGVKPFKCSRCPYSTVRSYRLKLHERTHTGEKAQPCPPLPYAANTAAWDVKEHVSSARGETPFNCRLCCFSAATRETLAEHKRIHKVEKRHQCLLCPYTCRRRSSFKRHMLMHTSEKHIKCSLCSYATYSEDYLKTHMVTHLDEKPYKCSQCPYRSNRSSTLKRHTRIHAKKIPLQCTLGTKQMHIWMKRKQQHPTAARVPATKGSSADSGGRCGQNSMNHIPENVDSSPDLSDMASAIGTLVPRDGVVEDNSRSTKSDTSCAVDGKVALSVAELLEEVERRPGIHRCKCGAMFIDLALYIAHSLCLRYRDTCV